MIPGCPAVANHTGETYGDIQAACAPIHENRSHNPFPQVVQSAAVLTFIARNAEVVHSRFARWITSVRPFRCSGCYSRNVTASIEKEII